MQFIPEQIELLWIIPAVAFAFFIFLLIFFAQRREERADMSQEVAQFNTGGTPITMQEPVANATDRLGQLERPSPALPIRSPVSSGRSNSSIKKTAAIPGK